MTINASSKNLRKFSRIEEFHLPPIKFELSAVLVDGYPQVPYEIYVAPLSLAEQVGRGDAVPSRAARGTIVSSLALSQHPVYAHAESRTQACRENTGRASGTKTHENVA
eukprot:8026872-Pyramimonas_sp.AAC.1